MAKIPNEAINTGAFFFGSVHCAVHVGERRVAVYLNESHVKQNI